MRSSTLSTSCLGRSGATTIAPVVCLQSTAHHVNISAQSPTTTNSSPCASRRVFAPLRQLRARPLRPVAAQPGSLNLCMDRDLDEPIRGFDSIADALKDLADGKFLVVLDDENRENEGDLIIAADKITTQDMAFLVEYSSGVVCISMEGQDLERLKLPLMVSSKENEEVMYTAFTITVDLKDDISTGISASDRAKTIRKMADPTSQPTEFRRPGHIFPLRYREGGVIVRPGHTEAALDLARLAGCYPAGVLCEIVNKEDGSMQRTPQLLEFSKKHGLKCITIADLIRYRLKHEQLVQLQSTTVVDSRHGHLNVHSFKSLVDGTEHLAFVVGDVADKESVLVNIHHESGVADLLGAGSRTASEASTSSSTSLDAALSSISSAGQGAVIYLRGQAARSITPSQELASASSAQAQGTPYPVDLRDYGIAMQMIRSLGLKSIRLMSEDAVELQALQSCGVKITGTASGVPAQGYVVNGSTNGKPGSAALAGAR